ncbi:mitochondrial carrier domain-containing protein [Mycotypha africana]|uniref:mitochondrial carrier domain-containing protein n=1 Tax=Mycotypha africana TaxID=64632 RepID=UPI00230071DB|nr:mitochondrial carrier domain-containing protein [Mycotypha africana]KAI8970144.1 mitochondrial carrier domain-containing protein [Mycotypha africana]
MAESVNDFIAGWISGAAGIIVGSPLDVLKVKMQMKKTALGDNARLQAPVTSLLTAQQDIYGSSHTAVSKATTVTVTPKLGSWATFRNMIQTEGLGSLFKGVLSPIVGLAGLNALLFVSYGSIIRHFETSYESSFSGQQAQKGFTPNLTQVYIAGCGAGTICFLLSTPIDLIKLQAQMTKVPTSTFRVVKRIYGRSGLRGFYQGGFITIIRDAPSYGLYFMVYEGMKRLLEVSDNNCSNNVSYDSNQNTTNSYHNACKLLVAGGMAGVASWAAIYPIDVVKSRLQMQEQQIQQQQQQQQQLLYKPQIKNHSTSTISITTTAPAVRIASQQIMATAATTFANCNCKESTSIRIDRPYASIKDCVIRSFIVEGFGVFFRGLGPTLLRAFPVNAVTFYVYEMTMDLLK